MFEAAHVARSIRFRVWLALSVVVFLIAMLEAQMVFAETPVVRMGQSGDSFIHFPLYVARDKGFFADEGVDLKVVMVTNGADLVALQTGGSVDISETSLLNVIKQNEQGFPMVAFGSVYQELGLDIIVSNAKLKQLGITDSMPIDARVLALKGLKIGISKPGASTDLFMRKLLTDHGMKPDTDVTLTAVGDGAPMVAALEHNVIDAFVYPPPFPQAAQVRGLGKIVISTSKGEVESLRGFQYLLLAAPRKYIEQSPDTVARITRALAKAERFTKEHPEEAKASVAKFFPNIDPNTLKLALDAALYGVPGNPILNPRGYDMNEAMLNVGVAGGNKYKIPPFDHLVDNRFAQQASAK